MKEKKVTLCLSKEAALLYVEHGIIVMLHSDNCRFVKEQFLHRKNKSFFVY